MAESYSSPDPSDPAVELAIDTFEFREQLLAVFSGTCAVNACHLHYGEFSASTLAKSVDHGRRTSDEAMAEAQERAAQAAECTGPGSTNPGAHYQGSTCPMITPPVRSYKN